MITQSKILDSHGRPIEKRLRAKFDAAQTVTDNEKHWAQADLYSPNTSVNPQVRQLLRSRSRYEVANNSFLNGMINTKVNFTIGRGPRLQMLTSDSVANKAIEKAWKRWTRLTRFNQKLRAMYRAKLVDGEGFGLLVTNRKLYGKSPVTLDLRLYEAEHIGDPYWRYRDNSDDRRLDGMTLDVHGDAQSYFVLKHHPGESTSGLAINPHRGKWVDSAQIVHLYREDRPRQRRGIPYTTPSLPLFSVMRRYTLAALHSSEWAAESNAVMRTSATMTAEEVQEVDELLNIPWARNSLLTLPFGWDIQQLKSEQPTTTFSEFYKQVLNEAARCLEIPFNVAAGNSSDSNMASGRLDQRIFTKGTEIERFDTEEEGLDKIFEDHWLPEYLASRAGISPMDINTEDYPYVWGYDGFDEDDPERVMNAEVGYWNAGLMSDDDFFLKRNIDPDEHYEKMARAIEKRTEIGMPLPGVAMQQIDTEPEGQQDVEEPSNGNQTSEV
jgi:capsid protein